MIDDGYGDTRDWEHVEEVIREKERLIALQAAERHSDPNDWQDLLNEARITIWEVLNRRPDAPPAYIHAATRQRLTEVATRGVWFGMEGHRGKAIDPIRRKDRDSFDDPDFAIEATSPDVFDAVEWGYHEGEILQAIRALPERYQRYVVLRFWGGLTPAELAPVMGVKSTNLARMWTDSIKPVLAEHLAHLVDA